jgi:hypothetical protein
MQPILSIFFDLIKKGMKSATDRCSRQGHLKQAGGHKVYGRFVQTSFGHIPSIEQSKRDVL